MDNGLAASVVGLDACQGPRFAKDERRRLKCARRLRYRLTIESFAAAANPCRAVDYATH
jgi:hypothetical protein